MPVWPGGPCPCCGEEMPPRLVHCRGCRTLLNRDLEPDSVEVPAFIPLPEVDSFMELKPRGYFISCPHCDKELKVNQRFLGEYVTCKECSGAFRLDFKDPKIEKIAYYADCPHCQQRLRLARKYGGLKVACKFCSGKLKLVE